MGIIPTVPILPGAAVIQARRPGVHRTPHGYSSRLSASTLPLRYSQMATSRERAGMPSFAQLVQQLEQMGSRPLWREASWVFCDGCRCAVDTDPIHPDGPHYADDGDFYRADCWDLRTRTDRFGGSESGR